MKYNKQIEDLQKAMGFVGKDVDGKEGPMTQKAILLAAREGRLIAAAIQPVVITAPAKLEGTDLTGSEKLKGVHPDLVGLVQEAHLRCDIPFSVNEGVRTQERQKQLVAAGASKTMNSRHLTGHAVDLWPIDPATNQNRKSDAAFKAGSAEARAASAKLWADLRIIAATMKEIAKERGIALTWGGDWGWDAPHFEIKR